MRIVRSNCALELKQMMTPPPPSSPITRGKCGRVIFAPHLICKCEKYRVRLLSFCFIDELKYYRGIITYAVVVILFINIVTVTMVM